MSDATLLFVHGTGVRSASYSQTIQQIRLKVKEFNLPCQVEPFLWGSVDDVGGADFDGLSLPDPPQRSDKEKAQAYRWEYLQLDPLFDLRLWCLPSSEPARRVLGVTLAGTVLWTETISRYPDQFPNHVEMTALLNANRMETLFMPAWNKIVATGLAEAAFQAAGKETSDVTRVFAEAVAAQILHDASALTEPIPVSPRTAEKIVTLLLFYWDQAKLGLKDLFQKIFGSATRTIVRPLRAGASRAIAPAIGDILYYQARGPEIRALITDKLKSIQGDIYVLAHSLGGIACLEVMVESGVAKAPWLASVKGLITAGAQGTLLYELDALQTLRKGQPLPAGFPRWLNLYDENDLLSYRANRLFNVQADQQVDSMLPPLEAHGAYWQLDETWNAIKGLIDG